MTESDGTAATTRGRHIVRLALFIAFLLGLFYVFAVARVIDVDDVRSAVAATGPLAPVTYVVVSAALGAIFVPGPILAAGSGVLFGPVLGTFVTLGATVGTAVVTSLVGRRAGRDSARALLGTRLADRLDAQIERGGLWAVVGQRFVPGISDALASYAFGAFGVPLWQMAVGALIGSVPRAFVYTALGASIGDLSAPLAYTAIAVWCVTAVIGAFVAHRGYRSWRGHAGRATEADRPDHYDLRMHAAVTVHMNASAMTIWNLVADVRNTGRFSPEVFESEWLDGVTEPALGARFRGHVKRNEIGPVYWTVCRVTACEPGREFGFEVLLGDRAVNNWHYAFTPSGEGTDVTESFRTFESALLRPVEFLGYLRKRRNLRDMRTTLERIRDVVDA